MKKFITAIIACVMVLACFAGCGTVSQAGNAADSNAVTADSATGEAVTAGSEDSIPTETLETITEKETETEDMSAYPKSYTFMNDQWDLYKAMVLSASTIKIECWTRFDAGEDGDPFEHEYDVTLIKTDDNEYGFAWVDEERTAFTITMKDEENYYWDGEKTVGFSMSYDDDATTYSYTNDKWDVYKAIALSDTTIKIECWTRFDAGEDGDPFAYEYDVMIINTEDGSTDFEWFDDEHSAFTITMKDEENYYWDDKMNVAFTIEIPAEE